MSGSGLFVYDRPANQPINCQVFDEVYGELPSVAHDKTVAEGSNTREARAVTLTDQ